MNNEEWHPMSMEEYEEKFMGIKKQKKEEQKESEPIDEVVEESRTEKLNRLKEQARTKRQELDDIYKEMENTI